jgi:hypothetical protein
MKFKKFIVRLLLFLLPLLLAVISIEYMLRSIPNDYAYKRDYLEQNASEIEVLILGNSHAYRSIISENIDFKAFNAAYISQSLDIDFLLFEQYSPKLEKLHFLVLNISYPSLFSSLKTSKENWRLKNYNIYYDQNITRNPINYSEFLSNAFKVNKEKFVKYYIFNKNPISCSSLGSGTLEGTGIFKLIAIEAAKRHTKNGLPYYKEFLRSLDKVIRYCQERGIHVILVTPPVHRNYFENLDLIQLEKMNQIIDSVSYIYDHIHKVNHLDSNLYQDVDFKNGDHVNRSGAVKFTQELNRTIKDLMH